MIFKRYLAGFILALMTGFVMPVLAGFPSSTDANITSFTGNCTSATVNYFTGKSFVRIEMTNVDTGETLDEHEADPPGFTYTASFDPPLASGTTIEVTVGQEFVDSEQTTVLCDVEPIAPGTPEIIEERYIQLCDDGRTNINQCEPIAIYPMQSDDGMGMTIWNARRDGQTAQLLYVSAEDMANLPETRCLIGVSTDGFVQAAWLGDSMVIFAGADDDNKTFIYFYDDGFPGLPRVDTTFGRVEVSLPAC